MNIELYSQTKQLMKKHQWESVIDILDAETLDKSNDWRLYWNAGWSNFKLSRFKQSRIYFQKAIRLTSKPEEKSSCLTFLGLSEIEESRFEEAKGVLEEALQLKDSTLARKSLALAYINLDQLEQAEKVHTEGVKLEPDNKERLAAYGNFLLDSGRDEEAEEIRNRLN